MSPKTYLYMVFVFSQQRLSITRQTLLIFRSKGSWTNLGVKRSKVMTINFECVLYFIDKLIMTIWWPWFFNLKITRFIPLLFQCPTTICMANLKCKSLKNISSWHDDIVHAVILGGLKWNTISNIYTTFIQYLLWSQIWIKQTFFHHVT